MKLRNKKTGEIVIKHIAIRGHNEIPKIYDSLTEFCEDWEDCVEPKEYWYIDCDGEVMTTSEALCNEEQNSMKQIGNCFETEEAAELAVRKLKAWKRLKDKGFRFDKWVNVSGDGCSRPIWFYFEKDTALEDIESDLDLLFSEVKNDN